MDYLVKRGGHNLTSVMESRCLDYSYKHIVIRHEFLIRSGLYKTYPFHKLQKQAFIIQSRLPRDMYFSPSEIICTPDSDFLQKCTNYSLTLNELVAFEGFFEAKFEKGFTERNLRFVNGDLDEIRDSIDPVGDYNCSVYLGAKDATEFYY